jgi:hypothetical protein
VSEGTATELKSAAEYVAMLIDGTVHDSLGERLEATRAVFQECQRNALEAAACLCCDWCDHDLPRTLIETTKGPLYIHKPDDIQVPCFADNLWRYLDQQFPKQACRKETQCQNLRD